MKKMLIVGITGRSGSGKSMVSAHYSELGYPVADGDEISRQVTGPGSPCVAELRAAFGDGIVAADGSLLRKKLAKIAFSSPENSEKLVKITHPYIIEEFLHRAGEQREKGARLFCMDGAVIVGAPFQAYCDKIIVVTSETRLSISRIILRDGISKIAAMARLDAQLPEEALLAAADYAITNNGSEEALYRKADAVLKLLLEAE